MGLLRNLATNVENRNQLINQMDLINVLMSLLQSLIQPFFQQSQQQPDRESQQLIDASIQVMSVFANDHENVHKIKNNDNLMQTLIGVSEKTIKYSTIYILRGLPLFLFLDAPNTSITNNIGYTIGFNVYCRYVCRKLFERSWLSPAD